MAEEINGDCCVPARIADGSTWQRARVGRGGGSASVLIVRSLPAGALRIASSWRALADMWENLAGERQVAEIVRTPSISAHPGGQGRRRTQSFPGARESAVRSWSRESGTRVAFMRAGVESSCCVLVRRSAERAAGRAGAGLEPAGRLAAGQASGDGWAVGIGRARTIGLESRESRRRAHASVASRACSAARRSSAMCC
jgi:hypothetical protein